MRLDPTVERAEAEGRASRRAAVGRLARSCWSRRFPPARACRSCPPTDPRILLQANPSFVSRTADAPLVTAVLTEPAGTFVPDGTVVYFFTNLGQIDGQRADGERHRPRVLRRRRPIGAGVRHGVLRAGRGAARAQPRRDGDSTSAGTASGTGSASVTISVGSALPTTRDRHRRSAPDQQPSPRDDHRQRLRQPTATRSRTCRSCSRSPTYGAALEETLDSGGSPRYTDSNGQAFDTLRTRRLPTDPPKTVTVSASVPNDQHGRAKSWCA